ncbi:MAG: hypothetical protein PVSMB5_29340 [Ktedonobacteraceae bacterium]
MAIDSNELLGKTLGTCTLKRLIGRGGMGAVYLAQQSRPRRTVAVKVVLPGIVLEQKSRVEFLARFRREADAIAALDHINIMPVYEYGEQGDTAYLVMPYVTGGTLRAMLEKRGTLSPEEVVPILEQTAAALDSAHSQSIVHRDLKPGNILFHGDGRVLLADFGLAKVLKDVTENESNGHLTSIGTIVGTPEYLSPEQGTGDRIDYRTDIYSLGIVLYQMLAGRVPFAGASPVAVAIKHALEEPPPPSRFNPAIPHNVEAVILKAIAKKPGLRYESAGAFAQALRQAVAEATQDGATPAESHSSIKPIVLAGTTSEEKTSAMPTHENELPTVSSSKSIEGKEQDTMLSTMLMNETTHATADEVMRASEAQQKQVPVVPDFSAYSDATVADVPKPAELPNVRHQVARPVVQPIQQPDREPFTEPPEGPPVELAVPVPQMQFPPAQTSPAAPTLHTQRRAGIRPLWLTIAGGMLVVILLGGGVAAYIQGQAHSTTQRAEKPVAAATQVIQKIDVNSPTKVNTPQVQLTVNANPQLPGPHAGVVGIGPRIYGTGKPGKDCDTQGAQWSNSDNAKLVCAQNELEIASTGSQGNQFAGTFLNTLPGNQSFPATYVVQTEATLKSGSQGQFGIVFYRHTGDQATNYAFIIDPASGTWTANYYDANGQHMLHTQALQTRIEGTVTIDLVIAGSNFYLYINGTREGAANTGFGNTNGSFGLLVQPGADVAFKNTLLYTTSI